jgi:hypothetical protein
MDEPANGFGAGRQVVLLAPPVVDHLPEAGRRHELDSLIQFVIQGENSRGDGVFRARCDGFVE